jgi:hypothetical protein
MLSAALPLCLPVDAQLTPVGFETLPEVSLRLTVSADTLESMTGPGGPTLAEILETVLGLAAFSLCIVDARISDTTNSECTVCTRMLTERDAHVLRTQLPHQVRIFVGKPTPAEQQIAVHASDDSSEAGGMKLQTNPVANDERANPERMENKLGEYRQEDQLERSGARIPVLTSKKHVAELYKLGEGNLEQWQYNAMEFDKFEPKQPEPARQAAESIWAISEPGRDKSERDK